MQSLTSDNGSGNRVKGECSEESPIPTPLTGYGAAAFIAQDHGFDLPHTVSVVSNAEPEPEPEQIITLFKDLGWHADAIVIEQKEIGKLRVAVPFIARLKTGAYIAVTHIDVDDLTLENAIKFRIFNPRKVDAGIFVISRDEFIEWWDGAVLLATPPIRAPVERERFGLLWFSKALRMHKAAILNACAAAIGINITALAVPVFFQIVVDKVLVHNNVATLRVLLVGVIMALLFEAAFNWLRGYCLQFISSHLEISISNESFTHLLSLPLVFFDRALAGVVSRQMLQGSQIKEFITGRLFMSAMDLPIIIIVLPILFSYDATLASIVVGATILLAFVIGLLLGPYRRRLRLLYEIEAQRQAYLVETIHGIRAVKSLGLESRRERVWLDQSAASALASLEVGRVSLIANTLSQFMEKGLSVAIIAVGAFSIFSGHMTVGTIVAFQMLAGRVTSPILQIVGLVNQLQETLLSISMMGAIMNSPSERERPGLTPVLDGRITFDDVSFRYSGSDRLALDRIDLEIPPGKMLGIVGRSGSGKSTLSYLIQALHMPSEGAVRFNSISAREIDVKYLRASIGVVPQDPFLFRGSVRENIAVSLPGASFQEVVEAALRAGAHRFIEDLPMGYNTLIDENASNLSGGQRQRICLARAIIRHPPILILDEATSSLDPESETVVVNNLRQIGAGRTTVVITHRLQTVRHADEIIVLDKGKIAQRGTHKQLTNSPGIYRDLWQQQMGSSY